MAFLRRRRVTGLFAGLIACTTVVACATLSWQSRLLAPNEAVLIDKSAPFLKVHMRSGELFVLKRWQIDTAARKVSGTGIRYDAERSVLGKGELAVPFDEISLLETNQPDTVTDTGLAVMGVLTVASATVSALCITNPKACFGSCPTFYAPDDSSSGSPAVLQAEGFSEAIAPSLEKTDVDALYLSKLRAGAFSVRMTNEALETHSVNHVRLLAVPRPSGGRVFHTRAGFMAAKSLAQPTACASPGGDCLAAVRDVDEHEYRSLADPHDLATRETVEVELPTVASGNNGIVIRARNTLLNTFLLYQTLAYAGSAAGEWMMKLERGGAQARDLFGGQGKLLGDIDVSILASNGRWVHAGVFSEVGPIARETQIVPIPETIDLAVGARGARVRLTMTKGNWRIDTVQLANIISAPAPAPVVLEPTSVERRGVSDPGALARLRDPKAYLVSYPGDEYTISFDVSQSLVDGGSELFLESRGYYLEWIREEWLPEENAERVVEVLLTPDVALRRLAPEFKKLESSMESVFWQSGYAK